MIVVLPLFNSSASPAPIYFAMPQKKYSIANVTKIGGIGFKKLNTKHTKALKFAPSPLGSFGFHSGQVVNSNDPSGEGANFKAFVCFVLSFLNPIPPILVTLAMLYFFWGIAKYMGAGDAEELKSGRTTIIYGMLAMFIVMGVWGIAALIKAELGF